MALHPISSQFPKYDENFSSFLFLSAGCIVVTFMSFNCDKGGAFFDALFITSCEYCE
jgi:hypothetical protein